MRSVITWPSVLLLISFLAVGHGLVHRISTSSHKLSNEAAKLRLERTKEMRQQFLADRLPHLKLQTQFGAHPKGRHMEKPGAQTVDLEEYSSNYYGSFLVGNISVGTPPQNLTVAFEMFYYSDIILIDSNATTRYSWDTELSATQTFNTSASSTYSCQHRKFRTQSGRGHVGKDVLNVGAVSGAVSMGILHKVQYNLGLGGVVGLMHSNTSINTTDGNLLTQLVPHLDQPIVTITQNWTGNAAGHITLGGLDSEHCQSNWTFAPNIYDYGYGVNATSASAVAANGTVVGSISGTTEVYVTEYWSGMYTSDGVFDLIVNASGGVWNNTLNNYVVDCDLSSAGNVVLNVGSGGQQLVITPADYVHAVPSKTSEKVCVLSAYSIGIHSGYGIPDYLVVGYEFLASHCLAYNAQTKEVGIANVVDKSAEQSPEQTSTSQSSASESTVAEESSASTSASTDADSTTTQAPDQNSDA